MNVLLVANDCNPEWPSLPVVGYKACRSIADHATVTLATHVRNRPAMEKAGCGRAEVVYIDNEYVARTAHRLSTALRGKSGMGWTTGIAIGYPAQISFEWEVWKRFRDELKAGAFDIVHRVTPMTPTHPSPLAKWSPAPFVMGPLNGGLKWPEPFRERMWQEKEWLHLVRGAYRMLPYHKSSYRRAACVLASFQHTIDDIPGDIGEKVIDFPEVGIDPEVFSDDGGRPERERLTFIYVGRLVPYKCPDIAVRAFAANPALREHRLQIVGDGPERERLEALVDEHALRDCVEFTGWKTQAEVGTLMREADVFVFPSIRELGAGVVVEAMACGLVPVTVAYGAPGTLPGETGITVPMGPPEEVVARYAEAMGELAGDPPRVRALSRAAHERALGLFAWDRKARKTTEVYEWVLGRRADKPDFYARGE